MNQTQRTLQEFRSSLSPAEVLAAAEARGAAMQAEWAERYRAWSAANHDQAEELDRIDITTGAVASRRAASARSCAADAGRRLLSRYAHSTRHRLAAIVNAPWSASAQSPANQTGQPVSPRVAAAPGRIWG